jgi:phosphoglycolate phosphatase-like HAD superfamily hydrolase
VDAESRSFLSVRAELCYFSEPLCGSDVVSLWRDKAVSLLLGRERLGLNCEEVLDITGAARRRGRLGIRTLEAISAHGGLAWNRILSSETVRSYKPDPAVYNMAVEKLDKEPAKIMMVAAHSYDLVAAGKIGFATAFVIRAGEDPPPASQEFDLVAANFDDLAIQINQKFSL